MRNKTVELAGYFKNYRLNKPLNPKDDRTASLDFFGFFNLNNMANIQNNYITIQGWMATDLKLKSNDLLVFALIFGFCQDGESEFSGSINYICEWLNCSRPTVSKSLDNLVELGLIEKRTIFVNNVTFNRYKISLHGVKKFYGGSKETLRGGGKETLHHKDNINTITTEEKIFVAADEKIAYPNIEFEELKTKQQLKNDYRDPLTSHAPIIDLQTFLIEYKKETLWINTIVEKHQFKEGHFDLAIKEYSKSAIGSGKDVKQTLSQWKNHANNWINYQIQKRNG